MFGRSASRRSSVVSRSSGGDDAAGFSSTGFGGGGCSTFCGRFARVGFRRVGEGLRALPVRDGGLVLLGPGFRRYPTALAGPKWATNRSVEASSAPRKPVITKTVGKPPVPEIGRLVIRLPRTTVGRVLVAPVLAGIGEVVVSLLVAVRAGRSGYAFQSAVGGFSFGCVRVADALIPAVAAASASPTQKTKDMSSSPRDLVHLMPLI
jgi:hypothetical protein